MEIECDELRVLRSFANVNTPKKTNILYIVMIIHLHIDIFYNEKNHLSHELDLHPASTIILPGHCQIM